MASGFIDLHAHGKDDENSRSYAMDGDTTALELESGVSDVPEFYASHEGKTLISAPCADYRKRNRSPKSVECASCDEQARPAPQANARARPIHRTQAAA